MRLRTLFAAGAIALLAALGLSRPAAHAEEPASRPDPAIRRVWRGRAGPLGMSLPPRYLTVLDDPVAFRAFWTYTGLPDPPEVDFRSRDVIARFYGPGVGLPDFLDRVARTPRGVVLALVELDARDAGDSALLFDGPWYEFTEVDDLGPDWSVERTTARRGALEPAEGDAAADAEARPNGVYEPEPSAVAEAPGPAAPTSLLLVADRPPVLLESHDQRWLVLPPPDRAGRPQPLPVTARRFRLPGEPRPVRFIDLGPCRGGG